MSYVLDEPTAFGPYLIATVSRHRVDGQTIGKRGITMYGTKTPTFVAVRNARALLIFDMHGKAVTLAQAAALCPALATLQPRG